MSPVLIKVANVLDECLEQVTLAEHEDVVEAFATDTPHEAFTEGVRLRRPYGCFQHPRADTASDAVEVTSVLVVAPLRVSRSAPVSNDEARPNAERGGVAELLRNPARARVGRDPHAHDLARPQLDDEEREERPEPDVIGLKEVARPDLVHVIAQEGRPTLARRRARSRRPHVLLHRAFGDPDSELQELAADALRAPQSVFTSHCLDELHGFRRDPRCSGPGVS